jgi:hypothetical protein
MVVAKSIPTGHLVASFRCQASDLSIDQNVTSGAGVTPKADVGRKATQPGLALDSDPDF